RRVEFSSNQTVAGAISGTFTLIRFQLDRALPARPRWRWIGQGHLNMTEKEKKPMRARPFGWLVLLWLAAQLPGATSGAGGFPNSAQVVAIWQKAGATPGWLSRTPGGALQFGEGGGAPQPGDLPAFGFNSFQPGLVAQLPSPGFAFGL